jgi:diguanylate cyclase (GGDEF)-like protein
MFPGVWRSGHLTGAVLACMLSVLSAVTVQAALPASGAISFRRVAIPDDIPVHLCTALAQDRDGFLWIGTQAGLVRYDGYSFRVYRSDPENSRSLGDSYVRTLFAASDGRLWVGTFSGGLSVYDPASDSFVRYRHDPEDPGSLSHDRVEAVAEDRLGRLWIGTDEGLDRLDPRSGRIQRFRHAAGDPSSLADDRVRALLVDRAGQVWVGGRDGLQVWRGERQGFARIAPDLGGQFVSKLFEDSWGRIWIGTVEHGAAVFDPRTGRLRRLLPQPATAAGLSHFWVYGIAQATPEEVWIATFGGGVDVIDPGSLTVVDRLRNDRTLENTIGGDRIGALLVDRSGVVWVGTWGQGIARHDPATRAFRTIRHSPERPDGLSHPAAVRALQMQDGSLWVGTNGNGIDILDRAGRRIGEHRPDPADPGALADGSVTCLAQARDGTIWVATLNGMLHRLRPGPRRFERLSTEQGLPGGAIRALTFGPDGALWIGAAQGMARLDPDSSKIVSFRHRPEDPTSLSGNAVEAIAFSADRADGTLWVGTNSGLNAFDPARGTAVRITRQPGRRDSLPDNWVPDLLVAADGKLWVATPGGAAILTGWDGHDGRTARFEPVADRLGRTPAPVEALIQDREGWIWLGPRLRVDPRTWSWQELGPADGCDFRSFFIASRSRTADGTLLFGSAEGLLLVRPDEIAPWTYAPPIVATALRVGGVDRPGAARLGRLSLAARERGFRLEVAALDFTAPQKIAYRYRLEGFDPDWVPVDASQRSLAYTNLPPGDYRLRVQGTNRAGRFSPHELRLPITVLPAFHQTAWFRALMALLLLAIAYSGYRLRVRRLEARSETLERLVRERTSELETAYARIEEASLTDPLTQLRNRRFLEQGIAADVEIAVRRHEDLVFLLLDLDHFKSVNDTYGHAAGDAVLVQTAAVLRSVFRASDHVVRWGGEEFLAVARFVSRGDAPALAEKIRAAIASHPFRLDDGTVLERTCSIGFAVYPFLPARPRAVGWEEIVGLADLGLYAVKRSGRNGWVGIEAGEVDDPEAAVRRFRDDPDSAVRAGEVRMQSSRVPQSPIN